jgi:hypothetical protein
LEGRRGGKGEGNGWMYGRDDNSISLHEDFKSRMDGCMDEKKGVVTHKLYMMVLG